MKKLYQSPKIRAINIQTYSMIAGSVWEKENTSGIDNNPGSQEDFNSKEEFDGFEW